MAKTSNISVRVDTTLKQDAEMILSSLGLTATQAINVFYRQITLQRGLPFSVKLPERTFNETTRNAIAEEELATFETPDELYDDLGI